MKTISTEAIVKNIINGVNNKKLDRQSKLVILATNESYIYSLVQNAFDHNVAPAELAPFCMGISNSLKEHVAGMNRNEAYWKARTAVETAKNIDKMNDALMQLCMNGEAGFIMSEALVYDAIADTIFSMI